MITTIFGSAGGTGKTMLATNLADMFAMRDPDFLLIDARKDHRAAQFFEHRPNQPGQVLGGYTIRVPNHQSLIVALERLGPKFGTVLVLAGDEDTAFSALTLSDLGIVPIHPQSATTKSDDIIIETVTKINKNLEIYVVFNRGYEEMGWQAANLADDLEFNSIIKVHPVVIYNRRSYAEASRYFHSVVNFEEDLHDHSAAANEMKELFEFFYGPSAARPKQERIIRVRGGMMRIEE